MFAKAFYVSFQQTLRSVALTFFPAAFISLVIWATAGSSTGNTSDPLRGSLWLWLALHLEHFTLYFSPGNYGALTYLPIGAVFLPLAALRSGIKRLRLFGDASTLAIILFFIGYEVILFLAAVISKTHSITPDLKYLPITTIPLFIIAWLTSLEKNPPIWQLVKKPIALVIGVFGIASIIYGVALFINIHIVKSLAIVIQPGWVGGISMLLLQIFYIPNIIIAEISYSLGFGYSIGVHTHVAPHWFSLNQIPALQIFGALPSGEHPSVTYFIAVYVVIFAIYQISLRVSTKKLTSRVRIIFLSTITTTLLLLVCGYLAGGTLVTKQLSPVGVRYWPIAASYAAMSIILLLLVVLLPAFIKHLLEIRQENKLKQVLHG